MVVTATSRTVMAACVAIAALAGMRAVLVTVASARGKAEEVTLPPLSVVVVAQHRIHRKEHSPEIVIVPRAPRTAAAGFHGAP